jgi:hypothetical protein
VYAHISHTFLLKNRSRKARKLISRCSVCRMIKHPTRRFETECRSHIPRAVGDICAVDVYGPLPNGRGGIHYIFVCLGVFTKIFKLYALRAATTKKCLQKTTPHYIANVTRPTCILNDSATQFTSPVRKKRLADVGAEVKFCPMRSPRAIPIERCRK